MTRKNETKLKKTEKTWKKENNTNEKDYSENEIPDLNSLKPLNLNQKQISETLTTVAVIVTVVAVMMRKVLKIK